MAVDVFTSPRISFSHDLPTNNHNPLLDSLLSTTTVDFDFDFCIGRDFAHEISSADELFANGQILPVGIKQNTHRPEPKNGVASGNKITKEKKRLIEFLSSGNEDDEMDQNPMPCWQIGRSSSAGRGNGLLRLRPLQFLTRSKSTGSVPNPKFSKAIRKQHSLREGSVNHGFNRYYNYPYVNDNNVNTRPSLRKGNSVRVNPVLNILPAKATVTMFASFFCAKDSKNKR